METNKENSWEKDLEKYFLENYAKATAYQLENYIKSFIRSLLETSTKQARLGLVNELLEKIVVWDKFGNNGRVWEEDLKALKSSLEDGKV